MQEKLRKLYIGVVRRILPILPGESWLRNLVVWPLTTRVLGAHYHEPLLLASGITIDTYLGDELGRRALFLGCEHEYFWEPTTVQILEKLTRDAQEVLLAGSHIGLLVLHARKSMQKDARVHTFEPVSELFDIAKRNFIHNASLGEVMLNSEGLSDEIGKAYIHSETLRSRVVEDALEGDEIALTTIDAYVEKQGIKALDLILLDVEGLEYKVFSGAKQLLQENPPKDIFFEISPKMSKDENVDEKVVELLRKYGYKFLIVDDEYELSGKDSKAGSEALLPFESNVNEFMQKPYFNVLATKRSKEELEKVLD